MHTVDLVLLTNIIGFSHYGGKSSRLYIKGLQHQSSEDKAVLKDLMRWRRICIFSTHSLQAQPPKQSVIQIDHLCVDILQDESPSKVSADPGFQSQPSIAMAATLTISSHARPPLQAMLSGLPRPPLGSWHIPRRSSEQNEQTGVFCLCYGGYNIATNAGTMASQMEEHSTERDGPRQSGTWECRECHA